jgi:hypothetical protein
MRTLRLLSTAALASAVVLSSARAHAGEFDAQGAFTFDANAILTLDFATFTRAPDAGAGSAGIGPDTSALAGSNVLTVTLKDAGYPIPLELPSNQGEYTLSYWLKGDCAGGFAVDYDDGSSGSVSSAFPTGRATSDGWIEMKTQPFRVDGTKSGVDARMFLSAYDADKPTTVVIDAVEVIAAGAFVETKTCVGLDTATACGAGELCVSGDVDRER